MEVHIYLKFIQKFNVFDAESGSTIMASTYCSGKCILEKNGELRTFFMIPVFLLLNVVYLRSLLPIYSILIFTRPEKLVF